MSEQTNIPENNISGTEGADNQALTEGANQSGSVEAINTNNADEVDSTQTADQDEDVKGESEKTQIIAPQPPKDKTLWASLKRVTNNGKMRFFLFAGIFFLFIACYALYSILSSSDAEFEAKSGEFVVPKTNVKAASTVTPEQAEYIKQKQEAEAAEAAKKNDSYIAGFVSEQAATDPNNDSSNPTQPGADAQQQAGINKFFDEKGNVYTLDQAIALSAQGQQIPGVTVGEGSINDPNVSKAIAADNSQQGQSPSVTPASTQSQQVKPTFNSYVVQPYSPKKTGLNDSSTAQVESLERSSQAVDQWGQEYMQLRLKKAQAVETNTQLAFEKQLTAITNSFKSKSDGKGGGSYSNTVYSQGSSSSNSVGRVTNIGNNDANQTSQLSESNVPKKVTARAGETYRTILTSTVNTDEGTEVIARIQNGPYKGETVMGSVKVTENNMQFVFDKILRKNKPEVPINAVARQIGSNSLGMADEIKKHTLQRYTSLVVASALSGVGKAYEQTSGSNATYGPNGTVITASTEPSDKRIIGNAVGKLGNEISTDIKDVSKRKPTYITNTGKVFNLFLTQDVVENSTGLSK